MTNVQMHTLQLPSSLATLLDLRQLVSAFIGAALALVGQWLVRKAAKAWTAKRLALAFWEELKAVNFYGSAQHIDFGGFSSQTFDTLFRELAESLPETLARDIMRYHWRMKYLEESRPVGPMNQQFWSDAKELHQRLLARCDHHKKRKVPTLMFWPWETCATELLGAAQAGAA